VSAALERERRRAAEALQAETASRLALLQAQIEPHFLFNTLANIHSLVKEDPDTASRIIEQNHRAAQHVLAHEPAAPQARAAALPPLLLQPLVENARPIPASA
jgi:sensor histidine kinase YesM